MTASIWGVPRRRLARWPARTCAASTLAENSAGSTPGLFAGSEEGAKRAALLISLVGTCRMLDIDPALYLKDVLIQAMTRSASPKPTYEDLTPAQWKKGQAT
jgi:hypothetical protein